MYTLKFKFQNQEEQPKATEVVVSQFVCCVYDHSPWIGIVCEVDEVNKNDNTNGCGHILKTTNLRSGGAGV